MDTAFAPEDLAFRDEVRAFFAESYDDELQARWAAPDTFGVAFIYWHTRLYEKGWIAPNWPAEYGGTGWDVTRQFIFESERAAAGIRDVVPFGLKMVGHVIYTFGSDEQKERFLPF